MTTCDLRDAYLDGDLDEARRARFERHLDDCGDCRALVSSWEAIRSEIVALAQAEEELLPAGDPAQRRRLEERAHARQPRTISPRLVWAAAAVLALAAAGALFLLREAHPPTELSPPVVADEGPTPLQVAIVGADSASQPVARNAGDPFEAIEDGEVVLKVGLDQVTLTGGTRLAVEEAFTDRVRLELLQGTVICDVEPGLDRPRFRVTAGQQTVTVTGTRFAVTRLQNAVDVAVFEGRVQFEGPDRDPVEVSAGGAAYWSAGSVETGDLSEAQRALFGSRTREPDTQPIALRQVETPRTLPAAGAPATVPTIEAWQQAIIRGDLDRAASEIEAHLATVPGDHQAWTLLADCRRKQGDWSAAVEAYEQVIEHAPGPEANAARFRAGALCQEQLARHDQATALFDGYLEQSGAEPLAAEALLRLARSHTELGHETEAREALQQAVADHAGTGAAVEARRMLAEMDKSAAQ